MSAPCFPLYKLSSVVLALGLVASAGQVVAQERYPGKSVRLIVPFAPGGGADISARTIAQKLTERLGQQFVVDNRPGGGGNLGTEYVAKAAPDGYMLLLVSSSYGANPSLYKLSFDPVSGFEPITLVSQQPFIAVVHPSLPVKSIKELVALAKARPGDLAFASSGAGGIQHLALEYFKSAAGVDILHVPYKGGASAHTDLMAGNVQMTFGTILSTLNMVQRQKVRALAVTTAQRTPALPDAPTMIEAGIPGFVVTGWYAVLAPAHTPKAITALLNREIVALLRAPDVRDRLAKEGSTVAASTPEALTEHLRSEIAKWEKVTRVAGIKLDATR
ncbi:MAG: tripartite tricarboxylate transporter substrate binding protein [Burkholderiales bacterium]